MSSTDVVYTAAPHESLSDQDLGPLAWVLDEIRKSLGSAVKALRRFVHDAEGVGSSDLASFDGAPLRMARQQLHQAAGALEMVGMSSPALLLHAMESAVQRFVHRPELCTSESVGAIERGSFGLTEYLEIILAGKTVSPVALFPQYRDVQALTGAERVHPADLWPAERRFREPNIALTLPPIAYGSQARGTLDHAILRIVKNSDLDAALELRDLSLGLAAAQPDRQARAFWKISAAFFDAFGRKMFASDLYVKRVASRILMQYASLARGDDAIVHRLVQDLLFFCSQAKVNDSEEAPLLTAVRDAFGLQRFQPVDYEARRFGRFDPAVLAQARKRISAAVETWSALAGGDRNKLKTAGDQFNLVCDSLRKLNRSSDSLAQALSRTLDHTVQSGEIPNPALAMEVATSVLYLQSALEEPDTSDEEMFQRAGILAQRLDDVGLGKTPSGLEPWMEELYRRVSDHQTIGSVVDELRTSLGEAERSMDQFFRSPEDTSALTLVPARLSQMRGVLSVLGLDEASHAVLRMRDSIERLLQNEPSEIEARKALFEKLGNSLGALGFMIDMLSYQRAMARKLFVYDEELGELRLIVGEPKARASDKDIDADLVAQQIEDRASVPLPDVVPRVVNIEVMTAEPANNELNDVGSESHCTEIAAHDVASVAQHEIKLSESGSLDDQHGEVLGQLISSTAPSAEVAQSADQSNSPVAHVHLRGREVEDELLDIFLEEASEVVATGQASVHALSLNPADLSEQTTLRRAFHTLKGSSRMVGLNDFGEAAWSMEQLLNAWLAEQKPVEQPLIETAGKALTGFGRWASDIGAGTNNLWTPQPFIRVANAMRLEGKVVILELPVQPEISVTDSLQSDGSSYSPEASSLDSSLFPTELSSITELPVLQDPVKNSAITSRSEDELRDEDDDWLESVPVGFDDTAPLDIDMLVSGDHDNSDLASLEPATLLPEDEIDFSEFQAIQYASLSQDPENAEVNAGDQEDPELSVLMPVPESELLKNAEVSEGETSLQGFVVGGDSRLSDDDTFVGVSTHAFDRPASEPDMTSANGGSDIFSLALDLEAGHSPEQLFVVTEPAIENEDYVKIIGDLRIGIPLYNVYLNEADEWSRRLTTALQEWSLELHQPLPDNAVSLAHSLAGSSATVGFDALSQTARLLEHALAHAQLQSRGDASQALIFLSAAEEIRRLLHQFAAGFLKTSDIEIEHALRLIIETEISTTLSASLENNVGDAGYPTDDEAGDTSEAHVQTVLEQLRDPAHHAQSESENETESESELSLNQQPDYGHVAPALSVVLSDVYRPAEHLKDRISVHGADLDDDIDVLDVIDPDLFPIFEEEAAELLPKLSGALRSWLHRPDDAGARNEVLRALHTLKGSSRLAGAMRLGEMAHRFESAIEQLDMELVVSADIEPLLGSFDALDTNFRQLKGGGTSSEDFGAAPVQADAVDASAGSASITGAIARPSVLERPLGLVKSATGAPVSNQSVRVRAALLDRLINQAGEVMITRSRMESRLTQLTSSMGDLSTNLTRLRQQLRDIEVQSESQMQSRLALSKDTAAGFDPLEFDRFTRVQELTRMMAESVNDVATVQRNLQRVVEGTEDDLISQGRQARELQRELLRTRMVEFEGIAERLYAVVRQSSKEAGKQIKLDITGGSIEMDRGVLDRMTPAFEHLLRNCVAHGIELPQVREAAGKAASGTIGVSLKHEGNDVSVEFSDDGAGLDLERIRSHAVEQDLVSSDAELSDAEAAELIFLPGFSTAGEVTEMSGRGIGMDVVRSEVRALGGRIETSSGTGTGTAFRMVLPLTTAVTQVVMLRAGDLAFGVPATVIELVRRVPVAEMDAAYASGTLDVAGEQVGFFWAGALLQSSGRSQESIGKTRSVVILRSASQRIAIHVDDVLGSQEVVVKNLGPQLSRLPGLAGMSVLASGAVVLIYNPVALAAVYGDEVKQLHARAAQKDSDLSGGALSAENASAGMVPLVLVVDDSITVRRVTQRLLLREGYRVALAADGLQALERLQEERPAVVLSDIEMPRMDGFDLARNIRADKLLSDIPIIMITSRIAQKHRDHATELGVNHYLGKPYADDELLGLVHKYVQTATEAAIA